MLESILKKISPDLQLNSKEVPALYRAREILRKGGGKMTSRDIEALTRAYNALIEASQRGKQR